MMAEMREFPAGTKYRGSALRWQREPPDSAGDWLWVAMDKETVLGSGICHVPAEAISWDSKDGYTILCDPNFPAVYSAPGATAWAKIDLPPREWANELKRD